MPISPVLVVHGGAGDLPNADDRAQYLKGVEGSLRAGLAVLADGAAAAVREAVVYMESHTIMNAGRGGALASDGTVSLDAGFMDGTSRRFGGVTGVRKYPNPVRLAEFVMGEGDYGRFVGPPDSDALALEMGDAHCDPRDLVTERTRRLHEERRASAPRAGAACWLDTVGAVALDAEGRVAAAVSTGGISLKRPGRIGDSPVVGGGFWADDRIGACVTTGVGEVLMRQGTARRCMQLVRDGATPAQAAAASLEELVEYEGDTRGASGLILVTREGAVVLDHNSKEMSGGWIRPDGSTEVTHLWCGR